MFYSLGIQINTISSLFYPHPVGSLLVTIMGCVYMIFPSPNTTSINSISKLTWKPTRIFDFLSFSSFLVSNRFLFILFLPSLPPVFPPFDRLSQSRGWLWTQCVAEDDLELRILWLLPWSAGITGVHHHTWPETFFFFTYPLGTQWPPVRSRMYCFQLRKTFSTITVPFLFPAFCFWLTDILLFGFWNLQIQLHWS